MNIIDTLSHYFKTLAHHSTRGNMDLWLAEHYLRRDHWSLAQKHIELCFSKGGVDYPDKARNLHREILLKLRE